MVIIEGEQYIGTGVSFSETFTKFTQTKLKLRRDGEDETLNFATIIGAYSGAAAPTIITSYVDPGAIISFSNGNFLSLIKVVFVNNWRFEDRRDGNQNNSQLMKTENLIGSVYMQEFFTTITTIPKAKILPFGTVVPDDAEDEEAYYEAVCEYLDFSDADKAACKELEQKSVTHMLEFGSGTALY